MTTNPFLASIIPESNVLSVAFAKGEAGTTLLEASYAPDGGFVGAFLDADDEADWCRRAAKYLEADFVDNTPGRIKRFADVLPSLAEDGAGECLVNFRHALDAWIAGGQVEVEPYTAAQDYGSCFPPGALIRMADGTSREIESVKMGDMVVTAEGRTGKVTSLMAREVDEAIYRIALWGHYGILVTGEHPILTSRGYVKAAEIQIGDEVGLPKYAPMTRCAVIQTAEHSTRMVSAYAKNYRKESWRSVTAKGGIQVGERTRIRVCNPVPDVIALDWKFGRLVGLFLAEGGIDHSKIVWTFSVDEETTLVAETVEIIRSLFGIDASVSRQRSTIKVALHSRPFAEIFDSLCGSGAMQKRLHPDLMSAPDECRHGMLTGWLDGDGYDRGQNVLQGVTISKRLAFDMMSIAGSLGMCPTIRRQCSSPSGNVKSRQVRYDVYVLKGDRGGSWQSRHDETHTWRKVRGISQEPYQGPVYNFSVSGDQSYVADEVGVHNCVDASVGEHESTLFAWRAKQPQFNEQWKHASAWYKYANRGYCSDGWSCAGVAAVALRVGCAFRVPYNIGSHSVDFTDEDLNERIVARTWCRTGIPTWMSDYTQQHHAYEDGAITQFEGNVKELRTLFKAGGVIHTSGRRTSGGSKPFTIGSVGPHVQSGIGCDDSDEYRRFCQDVIGVTPRDNDFPVIMNQTWGPGWRGECADQYWPAWWGKKPQGAWVWWASDVIQRLSCDYAWLPRVQGFAADTPVPPPPGPVPQIGGDIYAEQLGDRIVIRGELSLDRYRYIVVPSNVNGRYRVIEKPVV